MGIRVNINGKERFFESVPEYQGMALRVTDRQGKVQSLDLMSEFQDIVHVEVDVAGAGAAAPVPPPKHLTGLTEGRIVHYVMDEGQFKGEHRPAIVVNAFGGGGYGGEGRVNMLVFLDAQNDGLKGAHTLDKYSVRYSEDREPGTWHWPARA